MSEKAKISVKNLHLYYGENHALKGVNMDIRPNAVTAFIGPSGCGKSTFLKTLNRMNDLVDNVRIEGQILLDGQDIYALGVDTTILRKKVGMVFQSYDLFPHKTILENILLAPLKVQKRKREEVVQEAMELLQKVGLADRKDDFPRQLSGGQKQRVAIVRALCMHPEILLLDEITAALDPEMVREVLEVVLSLAKTGRTMLIVTHEMAFAKAIANRIIFLDQGEIVEESSSPKEFFEQPKTERARLFLQSFEYENNN